MLFQPPPHEANHPDSARYVRGPPRTSPPSHSAERWAIETVIFIHRDGRVSSIWRVPKFPDRGQVAYSCS